MKMQIWRWTELLQMLEVKTIGRRSHIGSQTLGEVHHCLVDVFLWQLSPDGLQDDFQLISHFFFTWSLRYFSSMPPEIVQWARIWRVSMNQGQFVCRTDYDNNKLPLLHLNQTAQPTVCHAGQQWEVRHGPCVTRDHTVLPATHTRTIVLSLLPSRRATALWPVPSYTAWWQRHIGVSSLPKATAQWCQGRTRTRAHMNRKSDSLPIAPPRHCYCKTASETSTWRSNAEK